MPITIVPDPPGTMFGPGISVTLTPSVFGPFPTGTSYLLDVTRDSEGTESIASAAKTWTSNGSVTWQWGTTAGAFFQTGYGFHVAHDGDTVYIQAKLVEPPSTVVDSGTLAVTYRATDDLWVLLLNQGQIGNFTSTDRANLTTALAAVQDVQAQTTISVVTEAGESLVRLKDYLAIHTLDALTLLEVTSGCTGEPVTHVIGPTWYFGVIVRICTLPPWIIGQTPDNDWTYPDLAVLRIFRGTDMVKRVPIHNSSHMEIPLPGFGLAAMNDFLLSLVPPFTSIEVDWAPGVTGQVYLMKLP